MLTERNLLARIDISNGNEFLLSKQEIETYPVIKELNKGSEFKNDINIRYQNLLKMLQLILVKRFLRVDVESSKRINYQECFVLLFLLLCGCLNEKNGIDFERGERKLNVASNVFGNRFFKLLAQKKVESKAHKIPGEGVHEGIFNHLSKSLSLKVSRLLKQENKKYFIDILDEKNQISKEKLSLIFDKIKEYCGDKTREIINGAFEIYLDLQIDLEKFCGKPDHQVQKLILK